MRWFINTITITNTGNRFDIKILRIFSVWFWSIVEIILIHPIQWWWSHLKSSKCLVSVSVIVRSDIVKRENLSSLVDHHHPENLLSGCLGVWWTWVGETSSIGDPTHNGVYRRVVQGLGGIGWQRGTFVWDERNLLKDIRCRRPVILYLVTGNPKKKICTELGLLWWWCWGPEGRDVIPSLLLFSVWF